MEREGGMRERGRGWRKKDRYRCIETERERRREFLGVINDDNLHGENT